MSKKATKRARIQPIADREELAAMATASIILEKDKAIIQRDQRLADINDSWNPTIDAYERDIEDKIRRMKLWASAHREAEFGDKRSIEICGHELSFRKGSGAVDFEAGVKAGDAVDGILALEDPAMQAQVAKLLLLREDQMEEVADKWIDDFTKVTVALDKNRILRVLRDGPKVARQFLESIGIRLAVREEFHFTPCREELAPATVSGGKEGE